MAIGTTNFPTSLDTATELIRAANDSRGVIATGGATNSATTINITSVPSSAPADGIAVIVSATDDTVREIVSYTGKTGTSITGVTRNLESSGAKTWLAGDIVYFDTLTALSRTVLVNALIALETKLGAGSDVAASGEFLRGSGAGASLWSEIQPGDISDYQRIVSASTSSGGSNTSTSTYATHLTTTSILPSGTWDVQVFGFATYASTDGNTWAADSRISAPAAGSAVTPVGATTGRATAFPSLSTTVVSNGVTATTFTLQFRKNALWGASGIAAETAVIMAICRRTT